MASLKKDRFFDLCNSFPDIYADLKCYCYKNYKDKWKMYKISLLKTVDYFDQEYLENHCNSIDFFDDVQNFMIEEFFFEGKYII